MIYFIEEQAQQVQQEFKDYKEQPAKLVQQAQQVQQELKDYKA